MSSSGNSIPPHKRRVAAMKENVNPNGETAVVPFKNNTNGPKSAVKDHSARIGQMMNEALASENEQLTARCSELEAGNKEIHERLINIADDNDCISYRLDARVADNEQLENQKQKLVLRSQVLEAEKQTLLDENADLRRNNETLTAENAGLVFETHKLKLQIENLEQKLSDAIATRDESKAVRTDTTQATTTSSASCAPSASYTSADNDVQLSMEQMDTILAKLMGSYTDIQRQAKDQAATEFQEVIEFQVSCQKKLEGRIKSLESGRTPAPAEDTDFKVESIQSEINREMADKVKTLEMSLYILQPQCNKVIDDVETLSSRVTANEEQVKELMFAKEQSQTSSWGHEGTNGTTKPCMAPEDDYNNEAQLKKVIKNMTKFKSFMERTETRRQYKQLINEAQTKDDLKVHFKELSKAIDNNGWDVGPFAGLMLEELHALRDLAIMRYDGFDTWDRSFVELRAASMK